MSNRQSAKTRYVDEVLELLRREYLPQHPNAQIDVYRYNVGSIEIRIVDEEFRGIPITRRDEHVWDILDKNLSDEVFRDISLVMLLAPEDTQTSATNFQFEYPEYSPGAYFGNGKLPPVKHYLRLPPWLRRKSTKTKRSSSAK